MLNYNDHDFIHLDYNQLSANDKIIKEKGIIEGTQILFVGLFNYYFGLAKNNPLIRFGRIALFPNEKIEVNRINEPKKLANVYLLECQSIGGFSCSPVFL